MTLAGRGSPAGELALIATGASQANSAPGFVSALRLADGGTSWIAQNVTAAKLYAAQGVLVAAVDTRPFFGDDSTLAMRRGYSLADGKLLWQRTAKDDEPPDDAPAAGVSLGRACDADCSLPCELVAAGPTFGAIPPLGPSTARPGKRCTL